MVREKVSVQNYPLFITKIKMDPFRKSVSFRELEEKERAEQDPFRNMFSSSSTRVLNSSKLLYEEAESSA